MDMTLLFVQKMGIWGFVLILVVVLLMFGGKKIPEFMKGLGKGMKEFKDASAGNDSDKKKDSESSSEDSSESSASAFRDFLAP